MRVCSQGQSRQHGPQWVCVASGGIHPVPSLLLCPVIFLFLFYAFGKLIWMSLLPWMLLSLLDENKQIFLYVSLHRLLVPFPSAYHMPTSLIDLAILLVSPLSSFVMFCCILPMGVVHVFNSHIHRRKPSNFLPLSL